MVIIKNIIKENFYRDSVQMMLLSEKLRKIPGVIDAAIVMGSDLNKETLLKSGILTIDGNSASETDTIISFACNDEHSFNIAIAEAEELLISNSDKKLGSSKELMDLDSALKSFKFANLAMISVPGRYVRNLAIKLLDKNIHVFIFSDHVPLEDEIYIKKIATERQLLVMGPEAGTSIIHQTVLGFGNHVSQGSIGIIGASGTGIQESSVLLDLCGAGISNAIGVGGRDLQIENGGSMTLQAIKALEKESQTEVVLLVSKPVDSNMRDIIMENIKKNSKKKYVLCLIGDKENIRDTDQILFAKTIQSSVLKTLKLLNLESYRNAQDRFTDEKYNSIKFVGSVSNLLAMDQSYIRGFFAGGTLCYEALVILEELLGEQIYSNLKSENEFHVSGKEKSIKHTFIDFGKDEFTRSRPHPIIDPSIRIGRLLEEAMDPSVAAIILDIITGYNVANDTIQLHAKAIKDAIEIARKDNRTLPILVYVCGTDKDFTDLDLQTLKNSGATVFRSNALMSVAAGLIVNKIDSKKLDRIYEYFLGEEEIKA
jgi:FdrA protein